MSGIAYASLQPEFSRRILLESAYKINPVLLSQAVDVSSKLDKNAQKPSKGLPGYFVYGWKKAADEIVRASNLGIAYISLRFVSSAEGHKDINAGLEDFETTLSLIQREIQSLPVKLIVDPFGLALTQDGQWGILQGDSGFDRDKTFSLLERVGCILSRNNVHGVVTLGRIPEEVRLTKKGIIEGGNKTKIYSFSQNSETSTAYVYLDSVGHNTGQKILPGNVKEMDLWALMDIWHGADVSVIKPMESYHLMSSLSYLIKDDTARNSFINSDAVGEMVNKNSFIAETLKEMKENPAILAEKCHHLKLAGYTVSGTTYMLSLLAHEKGTDMARARLEEMWLTALGVMDKHCECLIDRNASRFLEGSILC
jgi:delta-aminolevulinic acid dehydratase/porphobilinogen synthase